MSESSRNWIDDLAFAAASDVGRRRLNNQDAYVVNPAEDQSTWLEQGHLFVVADGMGAHAAGELASKLAADGVAHNYRKHKAESPPEAILRAVRETNQEIHQRGQANSEFFNMGTTCSALVILPQGALVAHVGDSRVYRVREGRIEQLTFDHSLLWEMRAAGSLASEQIANVPKNVITRSLGPQASVQVDLEGPLPVQQGDVFLLCSDGLTGKLEDDEIGAIVGGLPPHEAAQLLVDLANVRGGPDNITVVVVRIQGDGPTSQMWSVAPLSLGAEQPPPAGPNIAIWIATGVSLLVAAGLAIANNYQLAALTGLVGVIAGVVGLVQLLSGRGTSGVPLAGGRRLGKSPYATASAEFSKAMARQLAASVKASAEDASSDWGDRDRVAACLDEAMQKSKTRQSDESLNLLGVAARLAAQRAQIRDGA